MTDFLFLGEPSLLQNKVCMGLVLKELKISHMINLAKHFTK